MVVYLVTGVAVLVALIMLGRAFVGADPRALVRLIRYVVGSLLILFGGGLVAARRVDFGLPLIVLGGSALFLGWIGPLDLGGGRRTPGSKSKVTSAFLEMELDHDSGELNGRVLGGAYAGRRLDDLDVEDLQKLSRERPATTTAPRKKATRSSKPSAPAAKPAAAGTTSAKAAAKAVKTTTTTRRTAAKRKPAGTSAAG